jgi:hypothetical protein
MRMAIVWDPGTNSRGSNSYRRRDFYIAAAFAQLPRTLTLFVITIRMLKLNCKRDL